MSSYTSIDSASRTITNRIWNGIKEDRCLKNIIRSENQISRLSPREAASKQSEAQISVFLYNVSELASMRNQLQPPTQPPTLLYLNLHYLITPLTLDPATDELVLGKIMQLFADKPVLRGSDLQGVLRENSEDLRVTLDMSTVKDSSELWTMLSTPYKLSVNYSVFPIRIEAPTKPPNKPKTIKKPDVKTRKQ